MKLGTLPLLAALSCGQPRTVPLPVATDVIVIDTGVVIIRVMNHQPYAVIIYLDPVNQRARRVASLEMAHDGLFVVPSDQLTTVTFFSIRVEAESTRGLFYRTGLIQRTSTKITMVLVEVGPRLRAPAS